MREFTGLLEELSLPQLREIYGMAIKYILPKKNWNYKGKIELRTHPKGNAFVDNPSIKPMIEGFNAKVRKEMEIKDDYTDCLRDLVGYHRGLENPRCKRKTRNKRINRFKKDYTKILKQLVSEKKAGQGITNFSYSVQKQFNLN